MVRKVCYERFVSLFAVGIAVTTIGIGCEQEKSGAQNPAEGAVTVKQSAVTTTPPGQANQFRQNDVRPPPAGTVVQSVPRRADAPASQHRGHSSNKRVLKGGTDRPAATAWVPPPVPADYIAKQNDYQQKWQALQPTISNLSPEEQNARRSALKRATLGE